MMEKDHGETFVDPFSKQKEDEIKAIDSYIRKITDGFSICYTSEFVCNQTPNELTWRIAKLANELWKKRTEDQIEEKGFISKDDYRKATAMIHVAGIYANLDLDEDVTARSNEIRVEAMGAEIDRFRKEISPSEENSRMTKILKWDDELIREILKEHHDGAGNSKPDLKKRWRETVENSLGNDRATYERFWNGDNGLSKGLTENEAVFLAGLKCYWGGRGKTGKEKNAERNHRMAEYRLKKTEHGRILQFRKRAGSNEWINTTFLEFEMPLCEGKPEKETETTE